MRTHSTQAELELHVRPILPFAFTTKSGFNPPIFDSISLGSFMQTLVLHSSMSPSLDLGATSRASSLPLPSMSTLCLPTSRHLTLLLCHHTRTGPGDFPSLSRSLRSGSCTIEVASSRSPLAPTLLFATRGRQARRVAVGCNHVAVCLAVVYATNNEHK